MTDSENVALVRSICAAWERGDFFGSGEWVHPDIEFSLPDGPDPGSWTGREAMVAAWRSRLKAWEDMRYPAEEILKLDDERILVLAHARGRGKTSGMDMAQMKTGGAALFHIRHGKVVRLVAYFDRDRPFRARSPPRRQLIASQLHAAAVD